MSKLAIRATTTKRVVEVFRIWNTAQRHRASFLGHAGLKQRASKIHGVNLTLRLTKQNEKVNQLCVNLTSAISWHAKQRSVIQLQVYRKSRESFCKYRLQCCNWATTIFQNWLCRRFWCKARIKAVQTWVVFEDVRLTNSIKSARNFFQALRLAICSDILQQRPSVVWTMAGMSPDWLYLTHFGK